jgi:hypothetical protein
MYTAYLNNVHMHKHAGAHLRAIINKIFNTQEFYRCVRSRASKFRHNAIKVDSPISSTSLEYGQRSIEV